MKPRVLVTQPLHDEVLASLKAFADVDMNPGPHPWPEDEIARRLATVHGWIAFMTDKVDARVLQHAPALRHIACALKGADNFDLQACEAAGVSLSLVPDLLTEPTAELAIGLAIGLARHILPADAFVRTGEFGGWRPRWYGTGLHNSVCAVLGWGRVGSAIAQRLSGFGTRQILGFDAAPIQNSDVEQVTLDEALQRAHYLFLALPLTPQTLHLLGQDALERVRPGQLIINVGRGSVVNEAAMAHALLGGRVAGYAADVFEMEDWNLEGRPTGIAQALLAHPRTLFTPHVGSAVSRVRRAIEQRAVDDVIAALSH